MEADESPSLFSAFRFSIARRTLVLRNRAYLLRMQESYSEYLRTLYGNKGVVVKQESTSRQDWKECKEVID